MTSTLADEHEATTSAGPVAPMVVVVGFDGSDTARRALAEGARLLEDHTGWLDVVYVGHLPATIALNPYFAAGLLRVLDDIEHRARTEARGLLGHKACAWRFRRRDGVRHTELIAAAEQVHHDAGPDSTVVIVVGDSAPGARRSVATTLRRRSRFPVVGVT